MTKTEKLFRKTIKMNANLCKMLNDASYDWESEEAQRVHSLCEELNTKLLYLPHDFNYKGTLQDFCKSVVGKKFFSDDRCFIYLSDGVYEVEQNIGWFCK